jgi:signal transduction histidine kinase
MVLEGRLAERIHLAQELHDTLIQDVVAVGLQLDIIDDQLSKEPNAVRPTLDLTRQRVRQLADHGRRTLTDLRSPSSPPTDLAESLSRVGKDFHTAEAPEFQVLIQGDLRPLDSAIRDELEHIGREAITNAFRHARAKRIEVGLFYSDRTLRLVVRDDGCGIASNIVLKGRPEHFGLTGMRERAKRVGGRLTVLSRPGGGTEVSLVVPLRSSNRRHAQF